MGGAVSVILLGRLGRGLPPVIPGAEPVVPEGAECALCHTTARDRMFTVVGHVDTVICVDSQACVDWVFG
jgi:hypothetical protein